MPLQGDPTRMHTLLSGFFSAPCPASYYSGAAHRGLAARGGFARHHQFMFASRSVHARHRRSCHGGPDPGRCGPSSRRRELWFTQPIPALSKRGSGSRRRRGGPHRAHVCARHVPWDPPSVRSHPRPRSGTWTSARLLQQAGRRSCGQAARDAPGRWSPCRWRGHPCPLSSPQGRWRVAGYADQSTWHVTSGLLAIDLALRLRGPERMPAAQFVADLMARGEHPGVPSIAATRAARWEGEQWHQRGR